MLGYASCFHRIPQRATGLLRLGAAALAVLALLTVPARASQDAVQFGNSIEVPEGSSIQDAVCFFCSVNAKGSVNGDVVVFFGNARIDGHANHDVVVFFGDVKVADDASIGEDMVNFFGSTHLGNHATIGQDAVAMFGSMHTADSAKIGGDRVVQPGWIFWLPFLLICGGVSFAVREFRWQRRRRMLRGY